MKQRTLQFLILVCVSALGGWLLGQSSSMNAHAQGRVVAVPKSYRTFKAIGPDVVVFEANAGTIRGVHRRIGDVEYEITRN